MTLFFQGDDTLVKDATEEAAESLVAERRWAWSARVYEVDDIRSAVKALGETGDDPRTDSPV